jgi:archaellum component FlaC
MLLHKDKDVHSMKARALQTQLEKSAELVKKLEADISSKDTLIAAAEKELSQAKSYIHAQEKRVKEGILLVEELSAKLSKSGGKYGEVRIT